MAKRTPRSNADDAAAATPAAPSRTRRARTSDAKGAGETREERQVTADDPTVASAPTLDTTQAARPRPADQYPPEDTIGADPRVTEANHFDQGGGPTHDEIRQRAYEIYVDRGGQHGLHDDDWFRAEQELRARRK